jgi:hypothetical protein
VGAAARTAEVGWRPAVSAADDRRFPFYAGSEKDAVIRAVSAASANAVQIDFFK